MGDLEEKQLVKIVSCDLGDPTLELDAALAELELTEPNPAH